MKKTVLFVALLLIIVTANAQNPFEKFGYTPKIGTLSKGKYIEHFDTDSIVQIGSVFFNPFTKKITGFVTQETRYSEATLKPEIVSRWLTQDPLAEEFYEWSPYNFVKNNPIRYVDPDGRAPVDWFRNQEGQVVWFDNTSESFTSENGDVWQNVGANLSEVKQNLNVPEDKQINYGTVTAMALTELATPVTIDNTANISFEFSLENAGTSGLERVDGQTEITGVDMTVKMTSGTSNPGIEIQAVSGDFGVMEQTALGSTLKNPSPSFSEFKPTDLTNNLSAATGSATLSFGLSQFKIMTKNFTKLPRSTFKLRTQAQFKSLFDGGSRTNNFNTAHKFKF